MKKAISDRRFLLKSVSGRRPGLFRSGILQPADIHTRAKLKKWVDERKYTEPNSDMLGVAEQIGISAPQLSYYFRVIVGKTFLTWRKEIRIREAEILLLQYPDKSIASIGESVGIADKSNFRRQFTEVTGMSPMAYREKLLGGAEKE